MKMFPKGNIEVSSMSESRNYVMCFSNVSKWKHQSFQCIAETEKIFELLVLKMFPNGNIGFFASSSASRNYATCFQMFPKGNIATFCYMLNSLVLRVYLKMFPTGNIKVFSVSLKQKNI